MRTGGVEPSLSVFARAVHAFEEVQILLLRHRRLLRSDPSGFGGVAVKQINDIHHHQLGGFDIGFIFIRNMEVRGMPYPLPPADIGMDAGKNHRDVPEITGGTPVPRLAQHRAGNKRFQIFPVDFRKIGIVPQRHVAGKRFDCDTRADADCARVHRAVEFHRGVADRLRRFCTDLIFQLRLFRNDVDRRAAIDHNPVNADGILVLEGVALHVERGKCQARRRQRVDPIRRSSPRVCRMTMEMNPFHDEPVVAAGNMILLAGMHHADDIHIVEHTEADQLLFPAEIADIVRLSFQAAFAWTKRVGKSWAVYDGACRTYFQNVNIEKGIPAGHPSNRKDKIWYWVYDGDRGPNAYTSFLIHTVHQTASTNRTDWRGLYFVPDARILAAELELAHSTHLANAPAREVALNHHVAALQRKLDAAEEENADWLAEVEQAQEIAEFYRNENISLHRQIDVLRNHLKRQRGDKELDTDVPIPRGYDAMPNWVRQHLAGCLPLHPRAERAVGKAEYVEPEMVYRALLILTNEYRNSRMGDWQR